MKEDILVVTTDRIEGRRIVKTLGMVKGSSIRARHIGRDIVALARNIIGGEITEYTKLMAESREQALERMIEEARKLGANAIIRVRFAISLVMSDVASP